MAEKNEKSEKSEKLYYSMGEVAEMLDVTPTLLRFWEKRFDIIRPAKNKKGNRLFSSEDVRHLKTIYHLVKERGMTLDGAARQLRTRSGEISRDMEIAERLASIRALLLEVRNELVGGGIIVDSAEVEEVESKPAPAPVPAPEPESVPESDPVPAPEPEPEPATEPAPEPELATEPATEPTTETEPAPEPKYVEQTLF
jgi:DNA-binding transcriptional MerR regulator